MLRSVEVNVHVEETEFVNFLVDLIRKLGVTDRYLRLVSEFEFDPTKIDILYIKSLICDVLCPYSFKCVCILVDVVNHLVAKKLVEDSKYARSVISWLLDKFATILNFDFEKVVNLRNFTQDVYKYIAVVGPYLEVLVQGKRVVERVIVSAGEKTYRLKCMIVKLTTYEKRSFIVGSFYDEDRDVTIVKTFNVFSDAVTDYCTLRELLTLAVIAKELLVPKLREDQPNVTSSR